MIPHGQIPNPNPHSLTSCRNHRINRWEHLAIESPQIEVLQHTRIGTISARMERPVMREQAIVTIRRAFSRHFRMNDEHPHHAERHLSHFIRMRMIHVRAMLTQDKLVNKSLTWLNMWLR